ncbi:MAG: xanthine dehydrogenase family protein subunit M [Actinobacteria bacterium]|nr:xanthine dehydrogenase family protein subunit M [Actinomycetota bacterium]
MKPAPFEYHAPRTVEDTVRLLNDFADEAKILAGGQSLVPAMNFRIARPARLIDINRVSELDYLTQSGSVLAIGALTRHDQLESPVVGGPLGRLLPKVARHVGHLPIRTRGTLVGSVAHADPAAEWCAAAVALDADIVASSSAGSRTIPAGEFFTTVFTTSLRPDELITEVRFPILDDSWSTGFAEFSRRAGDFAIALAIVALKTEDGVVADARIGMGGVAGRPMRMPAAESSLVGRPMDGSSYRRAADLVSATVQPLEDIHGSVEYRRDLAGVMAFRALQQTLPI